MVPSCCSSDDSSSEEDRDSDEEVPTKQPKRSHHAVGAAWHSNTDHEPNNPSLNPNRGAQTHRPTWLQAKKSADEAADRAAMPPPASKAGAKPPALPKGPSVRKQLSKAVDQDINGLSLLGEWRAALFPFFLCSELT